MASDRGERQPSANDGLPPGLSIVVHTGTLGDLVLTFPILRALADHGPVWAVTGWAAARLAARRVTGVVAVDGDQPRWARLFGPRPPADPELAERLAAAKRVVSFVAGPSDAWAVNVAALAPSARFAFVPPRPPDDWPGHAMEWFDARLVNAGWPAGMTQAHAATRADRRSEDLPGGARDGGAAGPTDGPIVLHPGSGALAKCWPADRFWSLAEALRGEGRHVLVVLGEAERARWHEAEIRRWRAAYDVRLPDSLVELEALLGDAGAYVGNDSGPTHLAAAMGVPTVALFGPTPPHVWRPIGPRITVLAPPSPSAMGWLAVDPVAQAVAAALDLPRGAPPTADEPQRQAPRSA